MESPKSNVELLAEPFVPKLHVAVVVASKCRELTLAPNVLLSRRTKGDWASFIGFNLPEVVEHARQARADWEQNGPEYGPYHILVSTLDWSAEFPVEFTLKPLGGSK